MVAKKLVGPEAGVRKYDLLTALAVAGLAGTPAFCMSMTRLIALITARYNWRLEEVSIGQEELARLWSVDPRTVKREIKRLRGHGILLVRRPGVRGRVAAYSLDHDRIADLTGPVWPLVGMDFAGRMEGQRPGVVQPTVIPFPGRPQPDAANTSADAAADPTEWGRARGVLAREDPSQDAAWFASLAQEGIVGATLILRAPNRFHANYVETHLCDAIQRAVRRVAPAIRQIALISDDG